MSQIYINGTLLPTDEAKISVFDHGLLYGDGVFEGIRVYGGNVFLLAEHVERLYESAKFIRLKIPLSQQEMTDAVNNTVGDHVPLKRRSGTTSLLDPAATKVSKRRVVHESGFQDRAGALRAEQGLYDYSSPFDRICVWQPRHSLQQLAGDLLRKGLDVHLGLLLSCEALNLPENRGAISGPLWWP